MFAKPLMIAGLLLGFATTAPRLAHALTDHECWILFEANDTNGDGRLSRSEIVASDDIPESLEDRYSISFDEFMDACRD
jgi:hypothetical protein